MLQHSGMAKNAAGQSTATATEYCLYAVWGVAAGAFKKGLPLLQGVTAFLATTSVATVGLALAYGVPIGLHLWLATALKSFHHGQVICLQGLCSAVSCTVCLGLCASHCTF